MKLKEFLDGAWKMLVIAALFAAILVSLYVEWRQTVFFLTH